MRRTKIALLMLMLTTIFSCMLVYATDADKVQLEEEVFKTEDLNESQYEYVPIQHEEIVENLREDEDVEPIKPFYIPTEEELAEQGNGLQTSSESSVRASVTQADVWSDILTQAYGESYFAHHLQYDDGVRVSEHTNKLVIENTDLTLKGKNGLDVVLKRKYDNQYTNESFYTSNGEQAFSEYRYLYRFDCSNSTIYIAFPSEDWYYKYMKNGMYVSTLPAKRYTYKDGNNVEYRCYLFEDIYDLKSTSGICLNSLENTYIYGKNYEDPSDRLYLSSVCVQSPVHDLGQGWTFELPNVYLASTGATYFEGEESRDYSGAFRTLSGKVYSISGYTYLFKTEDPVRLSSTFYTNDGFYVEMYYEPQSKDGILYDFVITDAINGHVYYYYTTERRTDVKMRIAAIYDEFGNSIKFEYNGNTNVSKLSKITDTYGRVINFTYNTVENSSTDEKNLTITYAENGQTKSITYKTELLASSAMVNDSVLDGKPVYKFSVTNQEGETIEYYSRRTETIALATLLGNGEVFEYFNHTKGGFFNTSKAYNIEKVVYPNGRISEYRYSIMHYRIPELSLNREFYALTSSYDLEDGVTSNSMTYELTGGSQNVDYSITIRGTSSSGCYNTKVFDRYGKLTFESKYISDLVCISDAYTYTGKRGNVERHRHYNEGIDAEGVYRETLVEKNYRYYVADYPSTVSDGKQNITYQYHIKDNKFTGIPSYVRTYLDTSPYPTIDFLTSITLDPVHNKIAKEETIKNNVVLSQTDYTYNSDGEVASVTTSVDGTDAVVENYTYSTDAQKNIIVTVSIPGVTDADGDSVGTVSQTYKLDIHGNPVSYTDAKGNTTTIKYDGTGRIIRRFYPNDGIEMYAYDIPNNTVTTTATSGQKTRYIYDKLGNLTSTQYLDGSQWKTINEAEYDISGRMTQQISYNDSANGTKNVYTYDAFDRPLTHKVYNLADNTLQYTTSYVYAPTCTQTNITAADGTIVLGEKSYFDNYGRVYKRSRTENNADTLSSTCTYDYLDRITSETDAKGNTTTYAYDTLGNLLTTTYANGTTVSNTYDRLGRVLSTTDANGNTTNMTYDKLGRLVKTVFPIDASKESMVKYYYDGNGNLTKQATQSNVLGTTTPTFDVVEYAYDSTNNMVKSTQYANGETLPQITQYYYDESGNVLRMYTGLTSPITIDDIDDVTDGDDTEYSTFKYEYDKLGRLVEFTDALNKAETYTYDYAGNVLTKTDRDGYTVTTTYNGLGLPISMTSSKDNTSVSYTYDSLGNRKTMTDSTGTTSYTYDNLSRLSTETTSTGYTKAYTYDNNNNVLSFTLSDADGAVISSSYAYDSLNRMTSATNNTITETYGYDNNGNLTGRTNTAVSVVNNYNKANWQTRAKNVASGVDDIIGYYNYDGTLARVNALFRNATEDDLTTNYTYDGLNRLTAESVTAEEGSSVSSYSDAYTFDDNNNRATLDNGSYSYDANNRMTSSPDTDSYVYYDNGNLSADGTYAYVYDGFNRLKEIREYYDFNTVLASYTYNGDGQRITKTVDGVTTTYVWNGDNIVYETTGTTEQKYYYGTSLYAMEDTNGNVYYYGKNLHGDIVELYDEDGEYVRDYRYDAFGNQLLANTGDTNPFRYAGEYTDDETGLIYLRNRYYNPTTGRFITEDPIRDGLNWYVYCENNPVSFVDPSGLEWTEEDQAEYIRLASEGNIHDARDFWNDIHDATQDWEDADGDIYKENQARYAAVLARQKYYANGYIDDFDYTRGKGTLVYVGVHSVAVGQYHTSILIFADEYNDYYNDLRFTNLAYGGKLHYATIGAGPIADQLRSDLNRPKDIILGNKKQMINLKITDSNTICTLFSLEENFHYDVSVDYEWFPTGVSDGYNSNSFTHGLLNNAGITTPINPNYSVPGWGKPLPGEYF